MQIDLADVEPVRPAERALCSFAAGTDRRQHGDLVVVAGLLQARVALVVGRQAQLAAPRFSRISSSKSSSGLASKCSAGASLLEVVLAEPTRRVRRLLALHRSGQILDGRRVLRSKGLDQVADRQPKRLQLVQRQLLAPELERRPAWPPAVVPWQEWPNTVPCAGRLPSADGLSRSASYFIAAGGWLVGMKQSRSFHRNKVAFHLPVGSPIPRRSRRQPSYLSRHSARVVDSTADRFSWSSKDGHRLSCNRLACSIKTGQEHRQGHPHISPHAPPNRKGEFHAPEW